MPPPPPPPPPPLLDDNLIMEILSWLPVKPLAQIRLVCKSWESLICNPQFVKLQHQRSSDNRLMFGYWNYDFGEYCVSSYSVSSILEGSSKTVATRPNDFEPWTDKYRFTEYRLIGTCNGLISVLNVFYDLLDQKYCHRVCSWNPTLKSMSQESQDLYSEEKRTYDFGFGYDYLSDTHKVVAINGTQMVNVHDMCGSGWRTVQSSPALRNTHLEQDGVYLSGTLNWVGFKDIVSFHLGSEKWAQLSLPLGRDSFDNTTLGILRDCLCVFYDSLEKCLVVWQMKEFKVHESWTQIFKFDYRRVDNDSSYKTLVPLFMSDDDDVVLLSKARAVIFIYNEGQDRLHRKRIRKNNNNDPVKCVQGYSESLILPC